MKQPCYDDVQATSNLVVQKDVIYSHLTKVENFSIKVTLFFEFETRLKSSCQIQRWIFDVESTLKIGR